MPRFVQFRIHGERLFALDRDGYIWVCFLPDITWQKLPSPSSL